MIIILSIVAVVLGLVAWALSLALKFSNEDRDTEYRANVHLHDRNKELLARLELTTSELSESNITNRLPVRFVTIIMENQALLRKNGR